MVGDGLSIWSFGKGKGVGEGVSGANSCSDTRGIFF